ncbi:MAG TPA: endonuclease III, partial [Bacteroidota bacterium]|nr:endonuclease III [Bacteroidota bacterium]
MSRSTEAPGTTPGVAFLRRKTARVARLLEAFQGLPHQASRLPAPLDMLIATILSQNTNDKNSHRAYQSLRSAFPRWSDVADAPLSAIRRAIRSGGMARQKSGRIKAVLRAVHRTHGAFNLSALRKMSDAEVLDELTALNGVGRKTASCVLLFSLGRDVFPVDTHIHRICARLALAPGGNNPDRTYSAMRDLYPAGKGYSLHTNLIRFG